MKKNSKAYIQKQKEYWNTQAGYELSFNQLTFLVDCKDEGIDENKIRFDYSGRGMFGKRCPGVVCKNQFPTSAIVKVDNMGLDIIVYAQD